MKNNEMEVAHQGVILQRQPWETPRIYAAAVALSTQKSADSIESTLAGKNGS